jgi:hypothetical protein
MKSKIPRTVVHGSVLGPFEAQDFALLLMVFGFLYLFTGSAILGFLTLGGGIILLPKIDKLRYKKGPAYLQRLAWKYLGLKAEKQLPEYRKLWYKA